MYFVVVFDGGGCLSRSLCSSPVLVVSLFVLLVLDVGCEALVGVLC